MKSRDQTPALLTDGSGSKGALKDLIQKKMTHSFIDTQQDQDSFILYCVRVQV